MNKINLNEEDTIDETLSKFPPGEHSWYEVKGNREIDKTDPSFNTGWENDLSKALSAIANSGGGYLLLGGHEDKSGIILENEGIKKDLQSNGTKKWIEDVFRQLTEPFIQKIDVYEFSKSITKTLLNTALYIIEIDDSPIAPHQAKDNKYYIRVGSSSRPAPHQIVMDIMGRKRDPRIDVDFYLDFHESTNTLILFTLLMNNGNVMANCVSGFLEIPLYLMDDTKFKNTTIINRHHIPYLEIPIGNMMNLGSYPSPILRDIVITIQIKLKAGELFNPSSKFGTNKIFWQLASDNSPLKKGEKFLKDVRINNLN